MMIGTKGFIKLPRSLLAEKWAQNPQTLSVAIHLLAMASLESKSYNGARLGRGQVLTSVRKLAKISGLTERAVRTALKAQQATHFLTQQVTHQFSIITICKFDIYAGKPSASDTASDTQNAQQQTHINKNNKENKNNTYSIEEILLSVEDNWRSIIEQWLQYKKDSGKPYKSARAVQSFITNLRNNSGNNASTAAEMVNNAMANNWSGVFPLRKQSTPNKTILHPKDEEQKKRIINQLKF
ncbi:MAG: hypothetical protein U0L45_03740 [Alistipes sp.]|nr:hypothetical protein [Alistipes sp.]